MKSTRRGSLRAKCIWQVNVLVPERYSPSSSNRHSYTTDDYNKHLCTVLYPELAKYYKNRFSLFSFYNSGIVLDKEGWYSVTPESIAIQQAMHFSNSDIIVDLCCGCGGNSIQFANFASRVYAIDSDPVRIRLAKYNSGIYAVDRRIEFIQTDWNSFVNCNTGRWADAIFMSPPWGGVSYLEEDEYDIGSLFDGLGLTFVLKKISQLAKKVGVFLPRNTSHSSIIEAARLSDALDLEIEVNKVKKFEKGITIYLNYA